MNLTIVAILPSHLTEYCERYAKPEDIVAAPDKSSDEEELSEDESDLSDEQVMGQADL